MSNNKLLVYGGLGAVCGFALGVTIKSALDSYKKAMQDVDLQLADPMHLAEYAEANGRPPPHLSGRRTAGRCVAL